MATRWKSAGRPARPRGPAAAADRCRRRLLPLLPPPPAAAASAAARPREAAIHAQMVSYLRALLDKLKLQLKQQSTAF